MIEANTKITAAIQYLLVAIFIFVFMIVSADVLRKDWHLIFKKSLYDEDESVQSVVSANLTRRFFPPMVRVNPLVEHRQTFIRYGRQKLPWVEGPYWQHLPPLFTYVPLPFFWLDKHVTIEVKRLSYALVAILTGIIFIFTVYFFDKTAAAFSAALAAVFLICTPFTRQLITGLHFGISHIVLAFTVICSFAVLCWYLSKPLPVRKNYSCLRLGFIAIVVSLPIVTKNVLGAIPAATFFALLLYDHRKINLKVIVSSVAFFLSLVVYYGSLYFSSPETFMAEFFLSFDIFFSNYEGWQRPWHVFLSYYLPQFYLKDLWYLYVVAILSGIVALVGGGFKGRTRTILSLSLIWFLWNLLAISISVAKAPDYIYQTYLLSLFFGTYSLLSIFGRSAVFDPLRAKLKRVLTAGISLYITASLLAFLAFFTARAYGGLIGSIEKTRTQTYNYQSQREKFYRFGEIARQNVSDTQDIFILDAGKDDYWFRYYIIFLTGAETVALNDIMPLNINPDYLKTKYTRLHLVFDESRHIPDCLAAYEGFACPDFTVVSLDLNSPDFARVQANLSTFIDESSRDKSTLDLYELKNNYAFIKIIAPAVYQSLDSKCRNSLSNYPTPYAVGERFSLVVHRFRRLDAKKYEFEFLFYVNKAFEQEWQMCMLGYVKDEHRYTLSGDEQKSQAKIWWLEPTPPIYNWPAGEYVLVSEVIEAEPVPYDLRVGFFEPSRKISRTVDLGWVDLAQLAIAPLDEPDRQSTLPPHSQPGR